MGKRWLVLIGISAAVLAAAACRVKKESTPVPAPLVSISIDPSTPNMAPDTSEQLTAIGHYANNAQVKLTTGVTWHSSDPTVATVSTDGLAAALQPGSTTVSATVGSITGSTTLNVSPLDSISVTPSDRTIASGTSLQYAASGLLQNGQTQELSDVVTWDSSDLAVAAFTSAIAGLASTDPNVTGTTTISASFGAISGSTSLTTATVTSIAVTPVAATIILGATQQFTATATLTGGAVQDLTAWATWASSLPTVATVDSAGAKGLAVSTGEGTTAITASYGSIVSNEASLTVNPAILVSLEVQPQSLNVALGGTGQLTATGTYSDGTKEDVTASVTWISSNTSIATVDSAGQVTAIALGTTTIRADLSGKSSNVATVTVSPAGLTAITVTPVNPTITVGLSQQFIATGTYSDGSTQDVTSTVTWTSLNPAVATILNNPGSEGFATTLSAGTTTITASSGSVSGSTALTVTLF